MLKRFFASPQSTQVLCYAASQSPLNLQLLQQFTQQLKQASPYPQTLVHGLPLQPESVSQGLQKLQVQNTALVVIAADAAPASLAPQQVQQYWQQCGLSTTRVAQSAIAAMLQQSPVRGKRGCVVFLAQSAHSAQHDLISHSIITQSIHAGIRALAQSLAREFQPQGVHVVFVGLTEALGAHTDHNAVAQLCWQLQQQAASAWTQEVELIYSSSTQGDGS